MKYDNINRSFFNKGKLSFKKNECIPAQKMRGSDSARLGKLWRINFTFSHLI